MDLMLRAKSDCLAQWEMMEWWEPEAFLVSNKYYNNIYY